LRMAAMTGMKLRPAAVSRYSTLGGTVPKSLRVTPGLAR
jgi:hypothetical protein